MSATEVPGDAASDASVGRDDMKLEAVVIPVSDVDRARDESPFGTTIAHGNLTLSMIDGFRRDLIASTGFKLGVNYGWNRVRFPAPVPAGSRLRASAEVTEI